MDTVPKSQKCTAMALANLAGSNLEEVKRRIIQFPKTLEQVVTLLSKDGVPELQDQATRALASLKASELQEYRS